MTGDEAKAKQGSSRNRLIAGAFIFVAGQLAPLAIPLVANSSLTATWKAALSGLLLLGIPEIAIFVSVVILGKAGFEALKSRLLGSLKGSLMPSSVSRRRYYAGLVVFLIPVLFGWLSPYFFESTPALARNRLGLAITGDAILIIGMCMMGGQFWDKLRALFVYEAHVTFSSASEETTLSVREATQ